MNKTSVLSLSKYNGFVPIRDDKRKGVRMRKFEELIKSPIPVLVNFTAQWCAPCKAMKPILEDVKKQFGNRVRIIKIDVDQFSNLAQQYRIQSIPTFILFKNGDKLWRQSGIIQANQLKEIIEQNE